MLDQTQMPGARQDLQAGRRDPFGDLLRHRGWGRVVLVAHEHQGVGPDTGQPVGGWSLGPRLLAIAPAAEDRLIAVVRDELNAVSRQLGFLAFAVQRNSDDGYTVIARAERGQGIHISVGVGDTFPFAAPAIMRAHLAWGDHSLIDKHDLPAFTPETITDPTELRAELGRTRERGYGVSVREFDLGQSGIAAPVFDASGRVAVVLCALAFSSELNEKTVDRYGPMIRGCARRVTERTGGAPPAISDS